MKTTFSILLLFILQSGSYGQQSIKKESIKWFEFYWDGDSTRPKDAILVKSTIDSLNFTFVWQFDTGSPYTFFYGNAWASFLNAYPYMKTKYPVVDSSLLDGFIKMKNPRIKMGKSSLPKSTVSIYHDYGDTIAKDVILKNEGASVTIGTIGIDQFRNGVLIISFKENKIGYSDKFTDSFYTSKTNTIDFVLYQNRIVLPVTIGNKKYDFFYDSGASLFPLKTTKAFKDKLPPINFTDTLYNITTWGKSYNVPGGPLKSSLKIGNRTFGAQTIYVHPDNENYHTNIFLEAGTYGLIGNKLFDNKILVIDFTRMKFSILD